MKKLQIGIMGSAADLGYSKELAKNAEEIGELIAKKGGILIFGAEKDTDSLSTCACRGAKKNKGLTVGITYGKGQDIQDYSSDIACKCLRSTSVGGSYKRFHNHPHSCST